MSHKALISGEIQVDPETSKSHIHIYFRINPYNNCVSVICSENIFFKAQEKIIL